MSIATTEATLFEAATEEVAAEEVAAEEVAPMTAEAAKAVTATIVTTGKALVANRAKFAKAVKEAKEGQAHVALGFKSWPLYVATVFENVKGLGKADAEYLTAFMAEAGMSSRAIARVLGVSPSTAARMVKAAEEDGTVDPDRKIVGTDGKDQVKGTGKGTRKARGAAKETGAEKTPETPETPEVPDAEEVEVSHDDTPEVETVDTETVVVTQVAAPAAPRAPFSVKGADTHALREAALQILAELADRFGEGDVAAETALIDIAEASVLV